MGKPQQVAVSNLKPSILSSSSASAASSSVQIDNSLPSSPIDTSSPSLQRSAPQRRFISADSRYVVCEWIYQVAERLYKERAESRRVFHCAVHVLDRALLAPVAPAVAAVLQSEAYLQLTGLCSVVLAIAYLHGRNVLSSTPPSDKMLAFCGNKYSPSAYSSLLAEMFKFQLFEELFTPIDVLESRLDLPADATLNLALVLADSYILDYSTRKHSPQAVADCAYLVAKKLIEKDHSPIASDFVQRICFDEMFYVAYLLFNEKPRTSGAS